MSLSALLLGEPSSAPTNSKKSKSKSKVEVLSKPAIDEGLDALFRSSVSQCMDYLRGSNLSLQAFIAPPKPPTPISVPASGSKKRKPDNDATRDAEVKKTKKRVRTSDDVDMEEPPAFTPTQKSEKSSTTRKPVLEEYSHADSDENSDLEDAYLSSKPPTTRPKQDDSDSSESSEPESDAEPIVHESLTKRTRTPKTKPTKYAPPDETPAQRDARTIFVGNLSVQVASKRVCLPYLPPDCLRY